jgi:hypothetical protein
MTDFSELKRRADEQAHNVVHYLKLWAEEPTRRHFVMVLDSAEAYNPTRDAADRWDAEAQLKQLLRGGRRFVYDIGYVSGGRGDRRCLRRYSLSPRGHVRVASFRTGSRSWTNAYIVHTPVRPMQREEQQ